MRPGKRRITPAPGLSPTGSEEPQPPALAAHGVVKRYGSLAALGGVSLEVVRGECVALVGESGSGKTTLLRVFNRTVAPDEGEVLVSGQDVRHLDPVRLRRETGFVQQEGGLLPHWTVLRNASLVPWLQGVADPHSRGREALLKVGLEPEQFGSRWPRQLSGGQRQRVAIARALAGDPDVVLLDEPFGALDAITRSELQEAFRELVAELGITVLLVTHDLREAALLGDRVAVLRDGKVEQVGAPRELMESPGTDYVRRLLERVHLAGDTT